jgi:serine/threonine-protein kinase HipA
MPKEALEVTLPGRMVGKLIQLRSGQTQWQPDVDWESDGQIPRLGAHFLRAPGSHGASSELPSWFENLLPERGSPLRTRLCQLYEIREGASFALLNALGHDLPGAVEVRSKSPPSDEYTATSSGHLFDTEPKRLSSGFSALAGMQMKFSMSMLNERLTLAAQSETQSWIVKLSGLQFNQLAEVETATMTWAAGSGLRVPTHRTVPFESLVGIPEWFEHRAPAFAIERFDRRSDGSKVHHEDLCQALGLRPADKNGDGHPGVRYEGALRLVYDICGEADARDMARRLGFMIACGNGDAHLKNWGLVWGDRVRPTLSPCYDLVSTIAWEPFGWQRRGGPRLALALARTRRFADLDEKMLDEFARKSGHAWVKEEITAGVLAARDAFREVDVPIPERMLGALEDHWRRVPLLARLGPLPRPA